MVARDATMGAGTIAIHDPCFGTRIHRLAGRGPVSRECEPATVGRPGGGEVGSAGVGCHLGSAFAEPLGDIYLPVAYVSDLLPLAGRVAGKRRERHKSAV